MKITPLEIRQKTFEKNFRGYDKDEVNGYLLSLSQEWERMQDTNKELTIKLKSAEREVEKLREVENSLYKTLKTAEDTGANIMDQATKAAELHMRETELKAEAILNDARTQARNSIEDAELHAKDVYDELEAQVRALSKLYHTLETLRDDLLSDIKSITTDLNEKINRAQKQTKDFNVDQQLLDMRKRSVRDASEKKKKLPEARKEERPKLPEKEETKEETRPQNSVKSNIEKPAKAEKEKVEAHENFDKKEKAKGSGEEKSFFDEID